MLYASAYVELGYLESCMKLAAFKALPYSISGLKLLNY